VGVLSYSIGEDVRKMWQENPQFVTWVAKVAKIVIIVANLSILVKKQSQNR